MKKALIIFVVIAVLVNLLFIFGLSFPIWRMGDAMRVSTGLGAKLACSSVYISGFSKEQVVEDLASYSPATRLTNLVYDDQKKVVNADFWGMAQAQARFRPGVGCSLQFGNTEKLDSVNAKRLTVTQTPWPLGEKVATHQPKLQRFIQQMLGRDNSEGLDTRALVVVKNGAIVAEAYKDGISPQTPLLGWSMGKSLTAMMLGHLELQGKVDVQERSLFNAWMKDERAQISVENLLQMSSGLDFDELYIPGSDSTRMLFMQHSASAYALKSELGQAPGEAFYYSSGTSNLLARLVVERLGGSPQAAYDYLYKQFFSPLGMTYSWFEPDASGIFVGSSYPYISARDWARLAQLLLNDGVLNDQRFLSKDWIKRATSPNQSDNDSRYGYQFWLNSGRDSSEEKRWSALPDDMYAMHGNRSQVVAMFPSEDVAIVRLGWTSGHYPENSRFAEILDFIK